MSTDIFMVVSEGRQASGELLGQRLAMVRDSTTEMVMRSYREIARRQEVQKIRFVTH